MRPLWIALFVISSVALVIYSWNSSVLNGIWLLAIIGLSVAAIKLSLGGKND